MKNGFDRLIRREHSNMMSEPDDRSIETSQPEMQRKKVTGGKTKNTTRIEQWRSTGQRCNAYYNWNTTRRGREQSRNI